MINRHPQGHNVIDEEEGVYFIAVSDLMAGLLFVFIITLMAFVLSYQHATKQTDLKRMEATREKERLTVIVEDLTNTHELRSSLLKKLATTLKRLGVPVETDLEHGIIHLTEEAINFPSALAVLPEDELDKLATVAGVLADMLPCYSAFPPPEKACSKELAGKLDSVFIEGHTDNVPFSGGSQLLRDNLDLSVQRAIFAYRNMVLRQSPELASLTNSAGFPIFSVSGYGEGRPRNIYEEPTANAANRRIDLRFIMTHPGQKEFLRHDSEVQ